MLLLVLNVQSQQQIFISMQAFELLVLLTSVGCITGN